ncbi:hypothetical protein EX30DRAFT_342883 [Ascodesmis nigricans]|uniref:Uncharacterized protein n=1 Tax=Ascodesmis nigricans TaxID=341454 RepID=A0A4S2MNW9_9PEZI|nr:hypothetical protein EX30DRAFT_342883 [Ascodesmis nigricans]
MCFNSKSHPSSRRAHFQHTSFEDLPPWPYNPDRPRRDPECLPHRSTTPAPQHRSSSRHRPVEIHQSPPPQYHDSTHRSSRHRSKSRGPPATREAPITAAMWRLGGSRRDGEEFARERDGGYGRYAGYEREVTARFGRKPEFMGRRVVVVEEERRKEGEERRRSAMRTTGEFVQVKEHVRRAELKPRVVRTSKHRV